MKKIYTLLLISFFALASAKDNVACPTAAITYANFSLCQSVMSSEQVIMTGSDNYTGGTFSSTAGLFINSVTGAISPSSSMPGTYMVTYTLAADAGCPTFSTTTTINIKAMAFVNVMCGTSTATEIYIDWSNAVGISNYYYNYSINGGPLVTGNQAAPTSIWITNLNQPVSFTLWGTGTACLDPITITCGTLGTTENNLEDFQIGPNPVTNNLNIRNNQGISMVTAFNQLGQLVFRKEFNTKEAQLDFSDLKAGIYFITVASDKKQKTFKIVKN